MSMAAEIERRLQAELAPTALSIRDDSAQHAGHAGAREGGHFTWLSCRNALRVCNDWPVIASFIIVCPT